MRNLIKTIWHKKREGSSLVTVIIGILFIAAIGTILLTIARHKSTQGTLC